MTTPLTFDERKALRRRAWWTVADFARYTGVSHWQAKAALTRYDIALGGLLLKRSSGVNRKYGFYWALLASQAPEAFLDNPIEQQSRIDVAETLLEDMHVSLRLLKAQVGWVTREFTKLQARRTRAA